MHKQICRLTKSIVGAFLFTMLPSTRGESGKQPEVWKDPDTGAVVAVVRASPAQTTQSVRNQVAGVLDAVLAKPILPLEFGQTTISGLHAFYMRGVFFVEPDPESFLSLIIFSAEATIVETVTSSDDVDFKYAEVHANMVGTPNSVSTEVLPDILKRSQEGLPDLKRIARANNRAVIEKFQADVAKDNEAVNVVKMKRGDLAPDDANAAALNQQLRAKKPSKIYGWGAHRLGDVERTVTFIHESGGKPVMLVWIVNLTNKSATNISTHTDQVETLRVNKQINLPSNKELMAYDPSYDMTSFKNSDYYHGRHSDPLGHPLD